MGGDRISLLEAEIAEVRTLLRQKAERVLASEDASLDDALWALRVMETCDGR